MHGDTLARANRMCDAEGLEGVEALRMLENSQLHDIFPQKIAAAIQQGLASSAPVPSSR